MKRKDWLILLAALVLGAAIFLLTGRAQPAAGGEAQLRIEVPGQETRLIPLTEARDVVIEQPGGERNVVSVFPGGFRMSESNCKNHDCIEQGDVTADSMGRRMLYNQVICLPNRVVLTLVTDGPQAEKLEIAP